MRINNSGTYEYCRWRTKNTDSRIIFENNIRTQTPLDYFQNTMANLRVDLLNGKSPAGCADCYYMEQHGKVSGRQRQLLKTGVQDQYFEKSLASSPLHQSFQYSNANNGHTTRSVVDWQIDLGNYCNSACVFCSPESSSRLATEFKQLGLIAQVPAASWCEDPVLLSKFIDDLIQSPELQYLHFIGGETLITPGFEKILTALIDANIAPQISIGFTTNLTVWSDTIVEKLSKFKQVNLGMSIEALTPVNDYVRWPSKLSGVQELLDRWVLLGKKLNWLIQLRITPTCLSVHDLTTVYEYAWNHKLAVESCNFLDNPKFLRSSVLPKEERVLATEQLSKWIQSHATGNVGNQIINTRDPNLSHTQILQDATSYVSFLSNAADESQYLPELVQYLKKLELSRGNSILTYLPQYESFFRAAGY